MKSRQSGHDGLIILLELQEADLQDLKKVHRSLRQRWVQAHKRTYEVQRDELGEYVTMLEEELHSRGAKYTSAFK